MFMRDLGRKLSFNSLLDILDIVQLVFVILPPKAIPPILLFYLA